MRGGELGEVEMMLKQLGNCTQQSDLKAEYCEGVNEKLQEWCTVERKIMTSEVLISITFP